MTSPHRVVGIVGGMGPLATADLIAAITRLTPADREQDHLRLLVDSNPAIPDRTAALQGDGPSPGPAITESARLLQASGAELLAIACNTAHYWADEVAAGIDIPLISMVDATVDAVIARHPRRVGILAITSCLAGGLYQERLRTSGVESLVPHQRGQDELMGAISDIKAGGASEASRSAVLGQANELVGAGADVVIAGCTEIPIVLGDPDLPVPLISATDELARATIRAAWRTKVPTAQSAEA